jgi:putative MATE family efflux protein
MLHWLQKLFLIKYMVKPSFIQGELPTTRRAYRTNFNIAWPSALESLLVSLISSVDIMMVGSLGPASISAVGITNQPKYIVLALILSLNVGVTAVMARRKGAQDREGANRCLKQAIMLSAGLAILIGSLAFIFAQPLLLFAGAQADFIDSAVVYFKIIMIGNVFAAVGLTITAGQRGIGNTKISLRTNLAANGVNLVFNYMLINGKLFFPQLGVAGAGIATAIGNLTAFVLAFYSVWPKSGFIQLRHKCPWRFDEPTVRSIFKVSSSAIIEQLFLRIGMLSYTKIVASLGTIAFATHQICMNILNLSFSLGDGLSIASSSLVGQSLGAKRPDLAIIYGKVGQRFALAIAIILSLFFTFSGKFLVSLFTDNPSVLALSQPILMIIAITTLAQTSQVVFSGCLRGAGDTTFVAILAMISIAIVRPAVSWFLCYPAAWGLIGAWFGLFVDQLLRLSLTYRRFSSGRWANIKL